MTLHQARRRLSRQTQAGIPGDWAQQEWALVVTRVTVRACSDCGAWHWQKPAGQRGARTRGSPRRAKPGSSSSMGRHPSQLDIGPLAATSCLGPWGQLSVLF